MKAPLLCSALLFGLLAAAAPSPPAGRPAFCKTVWLFSAPCSRVSAIIARQIQAFNPLFGCEKCRYTLVSGSPTSIRANHTSPDDLQAETLDFSFTSSTPGTFSPAHCRLKAKSRSVRSASALDNDLNYCNIYDLVSESGLLSSPGVIELTNQWACMGFPMATCRSPQDY